ncbi:MAG TPA: dephospho-CoA kinase [Pseudogracilibacillus sp.]|nr:dephospho-CoA kinase [Pseudogracilibacillus sp.]
MTLIVGLTGSIGTGKSTIANRFKELDIPVVDADLIARQVVEPGEAAYEQIVETFGEGILQLDKTLDRKALGAIVFQDDTKRKELNAIIHPAIRKELIHQRDQYVDEGVKCVVVDIPLLYESNLIDYVDKVLVVYVDEEVQLQRVVSRDKSTEKEAKQRIASQIPVAEKAKQADAVIDNNGTVEQSFQQLDEVLIKWQVK